MERFLGKYSPYIYALLRFVTGFLLTLHGAQKLFGFPPPEKAGQLSVLTTVAGVIEFGGGLMILLGLFAGFAAFIASGLFAVAYFMVHASGGFSPIEEGGNKGERAVIYCFVLLYIAARGSGVLSIDSLIRGNKTENYNGV